MRFPFFFGKRPGLTLVRAFLVGVAVYILCSSVLIPLRTVPSSGEKTRYHLVNAVKYVLNEPRRGEVIAIRMAGKSVMYISEVVGVPGDTVEVKEGFLVVNGVQGRKAPAQAPETYPPVTVAQGELFVAGDASVSGSEDSVTFGRVERQRVKGRLLF